MLKELIKNRYSARSFKDTPIESEKVNYILECALSAPSKQSLYPYEILVLHNSPAAIEFKNWLFWHDTWTNNGKRVDPKNKTARTTSFNGQYRAPLVFLYAYRTPSNLKHKPGDVAKNRSVLDSMDMAVSASFAMLAAEEQGLRTCFGKCHSDYYVNSLLGEGKISIGLALGIGYATSVGNNKSMVQPVFDNKKKVQGYDTNNLEQSFPLSRHNVRQNKPNLTKLYRFI